MTEGSGGGGGRGSGAELADLRRQIDALDREIVRLLNERARLGLAAGRAKTAAGRPLPDPEREREVLVRVAMANEGPLRQAEVLELYRGLIEAIRVLEERDRGSSAPSEVTNGEATSGEATSGDAAPDGEAGA